jgi:AcrR family transcriptional regulator
MSPRNSVVEAQRTRQRIVEHSLSVASLNGLEGLTIGRIATDLGLSKAGVLGHFGTKEGLQLAVVDAASELFAREVPQRVPADAEPGLPRLRGYCEAWVSYVERDVLPGGCFFTAAASEFDGRGGPVATPSPRSTPSGSASSPTTSAAPSPPGSFLRTPTPTRLPSSCSASSWP